MPRLPMGISFLLYLGCTKQSHKEELAQDVLNKEPTAINKEKEQRKGTDKSSMHNESKPPAQVQFPELTFSIPSDSSSAQVKMFEISKSLYVQFKTKGNFDSALFTDPFLIEHIVDCRVDEESERIVHKTKIETQENLNSFLDKKGSRGSSKLVSIEEKSIVFEPMMLHNSIFIQKIEFGVRGDLVILQQITIADGC
jgi:hypothetical protein